MVKEELRSLGSSLSSHDCLLLRVASSCDPLMCFLYMAKAGLCVGFAGFSEVHKQTFLKLGLGISRYRSYHITARLHVPRRQQTLIVSSGRKPNFLEDILEDLPLQTVHDSEGSCGW